MALALMNYRGGDYAEAARWSTLGLKSPAAQIVAGGQHARHSRHGRSSARAGMTKPGPNWPNRIKKSRDASRLRLYV